MIAHPTLSISRQCHLLEVSRASVYRRPAPVSADDLRLTGRMLHAGDIMGIDVLDHLILADQRYYSLVEAGELAARVE